MSEKRKAWEITHQSIQEAVPRLQTEEEKDWVNVMEDMGLREIEELRARWFVRVPGSQAPDNVLLGAMQAVENKGYNVEAAEALIESTQKAYDERDDVTFLKNVAQIFHLLSVAPKVEDHPAWGYKHYESFEEYESAVDFESYTLPQWSKEEFFEKIHAGWIAQIAGAAVGTILEGYTTDQIYKAFGEVRDYLREPSTHNDDVLFELAFIDAVIAKGKEVTATDIAMEWVGKIEYTWTAEEIALKNLKRGIFPPESAKLNNPWNEWIGAQMRGSICGLIGYGNPRLAAKLAWMDGSISHINNGIIGEVFNAMLVSLAFVEKDVATLLKKSIDMIPKDSEYYTVVQFAYEACEKSEDWLSAWRLCEEKYKRYNWIHAYPNAAAEVVALYFGKDDFDEMLYIIAMCGQDVDCNAGQIATIYGVLFGYDAIDKKWSEPFQDQFQSLYRGYTDTTITYIAEQTIKAIEAMV